MLDLKRIREYPETIAIGAKNKGIEVDIEGILTADEARRGLIGKVEELKALRNKASGEINRLKKGGADAAGAIEEMRKVSAEIKVFDEKLRGAEAKLNELMLGVPNEPHESVPVGEDESANVVAAEWGEKPVFDFEAKNHLELGEELGILDFAAGAKISGSGFPLYMGAGARLERALINFMLDLQTKEHGYKEVFPPFLVNSRSALTTGQLPKFSEDMYYVEADDLYLIPTAEVPVTNIHVDEILAEARLPVSYAAYSACFRREAGSYGKETRGFLRVHQFNKVELVKFTRPEDSYDALEEILNDATEVLRRLGLHYRVSVLSTGDLSFAAAKCYDIEVWAPVEGRYLEASSCSNFEDFQARRGNIRFRRESSGKTEYVHTLNGSGLATSRLIVALMETYQTEDGTIAVPEPLVPYAGTAEIRYDRSRLV